MKRERERSKWIYKVGRVQCNERMWRNLDNSARQGSCREFHIKIGSSFTAPSFYESPSIVILQLVCVEPKGRQPNPSQQARMQ